MGAIAKFKAASQSNTNDTGAQQTGEKETEKRIGELESERKRLREEVLTVIDKERRRVLFRRYEQVTESLNAIRMEQFLEGELS